MVVVVLRTVLGPSVLRQMAPENDLVVPDFVLEGVAPSDVLVGDLIEVPSSVAPPACPGARLRVIARHWSERLTTGVEERWRLQLLCMDADADETVRVYRQSGVAPRGVG